MNPMCEWGACRQPAEAHLVWTEVDGDPVRYLVCEFCRRDIARHYDHPDFSHPPAPTCETPESIFDRAENRCVIPDGDLISEIEGFLRHPSHLAAGTGR